MKTMMSSPHSLRSYPYCCGSGWDGWIAG